jgi:hypothetical protein
MIISVVDPDLSVFLSEIHAVEFPQFPSSWQPMTIDPDSIKWTPNIMVLIILNAS